MKQLKPLFVVAAGSGGHILPALQWAKTHHTTRQENPIIFFTGPSPLEQSLVLSKDFIAEVKTLSIDKFAVKKFWRYPKIMFQVCAVIIKSFYYMLRYRPSAVLSTGGLLTIPVAIAARLTGCKVYVHELNVVPGKAVLFLLPWVTTLFVCFEKTKTYCRFLGKDFSYKCEYKDYPVRFSLTDKQVPREQIISNINKLLANNLLEVPAHGELVEPHKRSYPSCHPEFISGSIMDPETSSGRQGRAAELVKHQDHLFDHNRTTLLLLGGSQGSVGLNTLFKNYIAGHPELYNHIQIIHQTGAKDQEGWNDFYRSKNIPALTFAFSDQVAQYYVLADILISRAGAGSMFEALFFEKQTIVVPLVASSTSHQIDNAVQLAEFHLDLFTLVDQQQAMRDQALFDKALGQKIALHS